MHAIYKTLSTWDGTQVAADLFKILTNNLDINSYSASCDKTQTQVIVNTATNGWYAHDAAYGVLACTEANGTAVKYLRIIGTSTSVYINNYSSWNNVTHTGTIRSTYQTSNTIYGLSNTTSVAAIMIWQASTYIATMVGAGGGWNTVLLWGAEIDRSQVGTDFFTSNATNSSNMSYISPTRYGSPGRYQGEMYTKGMNYNNWTYVTDVCCAIHMQIQLSWQGYYYYAPTAPMRNMDDSTHGLIISPTHIAAYPYNGGNINYTTYIGVVKDVLTLLPPIYGISPLDEININGTIYSIAHDTAGSSYKCAFLLPKR